MIKKELEKEIEMLQKNNKGMNSLICHLKRFLETNLEFFKSGIVDLQDARNNGILTALNEVAKIYNKYSNFNKIETFDSNPKLKVIRFPSEGE